MEVMFLECPLLGTQRDKPVSLQAHQQLRPWIVFLLNEGQRFLYFSLNC